MNIRALLPFALLCSALALSACGNKGPLLPPPAPEDDEWPVEADDYDEAGETDEAEAVDGEAADDADAVDDADIDADADDADVDGEGDDPEKDPVPAAGDDGDGDA